MNEVEVKVLGIDIEQIREKLEKIGATLIKKEFQKNYMFDFADQRFFNSGGYVRIRNLIDLLMNQEKNIVTHKELISKDKFKISKEIEFTSNNLDSTKFFLEALGLKLLRIDEKYRESYKLPEGLIEIDTWAGVPSYLEAESETESGVINLLTRLGYSLEQSTSMSLAEILKYYHLDNSNRIFSDEEKEIILNQAKK